jgi:uncharacterized membrane protein YfcA
MKKTTRKFLYYTFLVFGVLMLLGSVIELFIGSDIAQIVFDFIVGIIFLLIALKVKRKKRKKK